MARSSNDSLSNSLQQFGLARDRMRSALARQAGIGTTDFDALEYLEANGPLTQRELGALLGVTSGAVTMLVDRMEQAGWMRRVKHPTDRRAVLIELSPDALKSTPKALDVYHRAIHRLAAGVEDRNQAAIKKFLDSARDAANEAAETLWEGTRK
jgi:DNA-binding MarR family transcriptional regulator